MHDADDSESGRGDRGTERSDRSVLLLTESTAVADHEACESLLVGDDRETSVLAVTYTESTDAIVERLWSRLDEPPTDLGVISYDDVTRSSAADGAQTRPESPITVATMADPENLKGLGTAMRLYLDEWSERPTRSVLCFTSLAHFLRAVAVDDAVQFLEEVGTLLAETDAVGHFHLDPGAVDGGVLDRLRPAFDAVRDATGEDRAPRMLTTDVVHRLLSDERRRYALAYLHEVGMPVTTRTLAERIAARESGVDPSELAPEQVERIRTSLATAHVPLLKDAGVLESGEEESVVRFTARATENETLQTLLDLAGREYGIE